MKSEKWNDKGPALKKYCQTEINHLAVKIARRSQTDRQQHFIKCCNNFFSIFHLPQVVISVSNLKCCNEHMSRIIIHFVLFFYFVLIVAVLFFFLRLFLFRVIPFLVLFLAMLFVMFFLFFFVW